MIRSEEVFQIGVLGKTHGVKGEINFIFEDDVFDRVDADYLVLELDGILVPFFIEEYRFRSDDRALLKFEDIDSEERAKDFIGVKVFFPYALNDKNLKNERRWKDFIGYDIENVGKINDVNDATQNVLFEVYYKDRLVLIPAAEELVSMVNHEEKMIKMEIPQGLLDI